MKVEKTTIKDTDKIFKPFTIELTIETIEEARLLFHISNHSKIRELIMNDKKYILDVNYSNSITDNIPYLWNLIKKEITKQKFDL